MTVRTPWPRHPMNIVGIDIGGTFTDLVGLRRRLIVTVEDADRAGRSDRRGRHRAAPRRLRCDRGRRTAARLDHRDQHRAGAQRRRTALVTTRGLSRRLRARPRQPAGRLQSRFPPRRGRWCRANSPSRSPSDERRGRDLCRSTAGVERWRNTRTSRHRGRRGLLPALLRQPGARDRWPAKSLRECSAQAFVTLSHEILREFREYERTSTTVLNAYVGPRVSSYLGRLEGFAARRFRRPDRHHALERRHHVDRRGAAATGRHDGIRPRGRHDRRRRASARLLGLEQRRSASTWAAPRRRPH